MTQATPLRLRLDEGWCHAWWHAPAAPARGLTVVLCPPIGYEAVASYPTQVQLARHLAAAGLPVLRIDYHGTGDSDGDDTQPGRVPAWLASVQAAVAEAMRLGDGGAIALVGIRMGATLAAEAAARLGGVDSLLLWAPLPGGKAFVREIRAAGDSADDGSLHGFGFHYGTQTVRDLEALDLRQLATPPARRAWLIPRDDVTVAGPLPRLLSALGVDTRFDGLPGYAAMVSGEPRGGVLDAPTLDALTRWLCESPAAVPRELSPRDPAPARCGHTGGVVEETLWLGPTHPLAGVLATPLRADDRQRQTGVILLNVGANYRVGPHRLYVKAARAMAAAGWPTLRLDLAGLGDSPPHPGQGWASLYDRDATQDVRQAMDALAARGCREFVLMGVCSGSFVAFQSALVDERVASVVLMNSRLLEWTPGQPGDAWQSSMQQHAKSSDWYLRAALTAEPWRRLLRGEVNVRLVARRFADLARARLARLLSGDGHDPLRARMEGLCRRGTDVLMVVSDADDGRDYVEFHFGAEGRRMRAHPNFRMVYVKDADHTFSRPGNQDQVLPELLRHLEARAAGLDQPAQEAHTLLVGPAHAG
ncbi:alpha/beta hydrolase [Ramlibacter sp. AW1]|uniref:Alpha/beta hydrolase n=1 Tax=Ramlibacter aurantiacus TaxID=2801330 RepID=A0A936ZCZ9_9BURK|nr:alpha/beta fold hydrolase [Ramlibacter aurantiacus]MBL0419349.1 alpha/beta hydrolase [Ramlibacter aurantiacus]